MIIWSEQLAEALDRLVENSAGVKWALVYGSNLTCITVTRFNNTVNEISQLWLKGMRRRSGRSEQQGDPSQSDKDELLLSAWGQAYWACKIRRKLGAIYNKHQLNYSMPLDLFWHRHFTHPGVIPVQAVMSHSSQVALCVLKTGSHLKKKRSSLLNNIQKKKPAGLVQLKYLLSTKRFMGTTDDTATSDTFLQRFLD